MTWFVLLIQDGSPVITEAPSHECFATKEEAEIFAMDCAKRDVDGDETAVYHVMTTITTVQIKRRVHIKTMNVLRDA